MRRTTILVTGAAEVVGQALLSRLKDRNEADVICLVHRRSIREHPRLRAAQGDITKPRLGLSPADYDALARRVDSVIHCAALTPAHRVVGTLEATNAGGTEEVVKLAEAGGVPLCHVSTAHVRAQVDGHPGRPSARYVASRRLAEDAVRAGSVPYLILRPSVVLGDSRTGHIASFQGFYRAAAAILKGILPVIPFDAASPMCGSRPVNGRSRWGTPSTCAWGSAGRSAWAAGVAWASRRHRLPRRGPCPRSSISFPRRLGTP